MYEASKHKLTFGGLDLTGGTEYKGARFVAKADGATLGNPEPVVQSISSALLDGSFVETESHGNRTPSFQVWIEAPDSIALAYGEKLLFEQCSGPAELGWKPPDGWGAKTVYEAFTSSLSHQFDDLEETLFLRRSYLLSLTCYPFGFSEDEIIDAAVVGSSATASPVVISNGTSATGWSSPDGAVTVVSGALQLPTHVSLSQYQREGKATYLPGGSIDFTTTPYLYADLYMTNSRSISARLQTPGASRVPMSEVAQPDGSVRFMWKLPATSFTQIGFLANAVIDVPPGTPLPTVVMRVDNVTRTNVAPAASTTGRESERLLEVTGSARTAGSVAIEHETAGLGDVIFYTSSELASGYTPAMRAFKVAQTGDQEDTASVSGNVTTTSNPMVFNVPAAAMPVGPHLLMMRTTSAVAASSVTVSTVIGTTVVNSQSLTPPAGAIGNVVLGVVTMPTVDIPAVSTATIRITINGATGSFALDELWSFYLGGDSDLTQVACGTGTPAAGGVANRMFIDAPSIENGGRPALYVGTAADRSDAFRPTVASVKSWGRHMFKPPFTRMFVVTSGGGNPNVTLRHRPAWFTHAGK